MNAVDERAGALTGDALDLTGEVIGARYRIIRKLTDGGMSRVFLAEQMDLGRTVVVKVLMVPDSVRSDEERVMWHKRFEREAASLAGISHPNVIGVHEYGVTQDRLPFLVMEYAEGNTLAGYVRSHTALEPQIAVRIANQIAGALVEVHSAGLIHRDLKPQNIILLKNRTNRVKVLDFGLAKRVDGADDPDSTKGDIRLGSPRYMAPEQVKGEPISPATDIYALGCILYFMLTGRAPFTGANSMSVMLAHLSETPEPITTVNPNCTASAALVRMIMQCLEKKPSARFTDMEEVLRALAVCPESNGDGVGQASTDRAALSTTVLLDASQSSVTKRTPRATFVAVAAALVAGALGAWSTARMGSASHREPSAATTEVSRSQPSTVSAVAVPAPQATVAAVDASHPVAPQMEISTSTGDLVPTPPEKRAPGRVRVSTRGNRPRTDEPASSSSLPSAPIVPAGSSDNLNPWEGE